MAPTARSHQFLDLYTISSLLHILTNICPKAVTNEISQSMASKYHWFVNMVSPQPAPYGAVTILYARMLRNTPKPSCTTILPTLMSNYKIFSVPRSVSIIWINRIVVHGSQASWITTLPPICQNPKIQIFDIDRKIAPSIRLRAPFLAP